MILLSQRGDANNNTQQRTMSNNNINPSPLATATDLGFSWGGMEGQSTTLIIRADHAELLDTPHPDVPEESMTISIPEARRIFIRMREAEEAGHVFPMHSFKA